MGLQHSHGWCITTQIWLIHRIRTFVDINIFIYEKSNTQIKKISKVMKITRKQGRTTIRLGGWRGENKQQPNMWKVLWRKLRREKRKILESSNTTTFYSSGPKLIPYDPFSYSQNFDQGTAGEELDNLSRSFSARFALADVASATFLHKQHLP